MTELCIYQCDICGETFDNENDCRKHEIEHSVAELKDALVMMDSDGEILPLDDMHTAIERSYTIYVKCKDAADILWGLFKEEGFCTPASDVETPILYPTFFTFNQDDCQWQNMRDLEEEYNRLLELKTIAESILLH